MAGARPLALLMPRVVMIPAARVGVFPVGRAATGRTEACAGSAQPADCKSERNAKRDDGKDAQPTRHPAYPDDGNSQCDGNRVFQKPCHSKHQVGI